MSKTIKVALICFGLSAIIAIFPLLTIRDSEFGGADGAAEDAIATVNPDYEAWFDPILEPPGGETESLLFCLQAAAGSGAFFYFLGYFVARKKFGKEDKDK